MEIPKDLKDEIWEYCRLNDITDINIFITKMLRQGYNIEKYGATPFKISQKEPDVIEKEVIVEVEKIVEVPVEVIKEVIVEKEVIKEVFINKTGDKQVEKIVEVPVEVIREVIVEKIVEVNTDSFEEIKKLKQQIENLKIEVELEKNRNPQTIKAEKPKEDNSKSNLNNVISWVSKTERGKDLYGE